MTSYTSPHIDRIFRAWIPTVSGRLSYSVIGHTNFPQTAVTENKTDGQTRFVVSHQTRNCSDVLIPAKTFFGPVLFRLEGMLHFLCVANSSYQSATDGDDLVGSLFIFPDSLSWKNIMRPNADDAIAHLENYQSLDGNNLNEYFENSLQSIVKEAKCQAAFYVNFRLSRNGNLEITTDKKWLSVAKICQPTRWWRRVFFQKKIEVDAPARDEEHILVAQLYFFIRDLVHRHLHHPPSTDKILDIYEIEDVNGNADDLTWRVSTIRSMYRKIIGLKRTSEISRLNESLGIMAYAKSFLSCCEEEMDLENYKKIPKHYSQFIESSVSTHEHKLYQEEQSRSNQIVRLSSIFFGFVGITLSAVSLIGVSSISVTPNKALIEIAKFYVGNTPLAMASTVSFFLVVCVVFGLTKAERLSIVLSATRYLNKFSRLAVALTFASIGVLSFAGGLYLLFS